MTYVELGHHSKVITHATMKSMGMQVAGTFKPYKEYNLKKAKTCRICKKVVAHSKNLGERLFYDISLPSTPILELRNIGYMP